MPSAAVVPAQFGNGAGALLHQLTKPVVPDLVRDPISIKHSGRPSSVW